MGNKNSNKKTHGLLGVNDRQGREMTPSYSQNGIKFESTPQQFLKARVIMEFIRTICMVLITIVILIGITILLKNKDSFDDNFRKMSSDLENITNFTNKVENWSAKLESSIKENDVMNKTSLIIKDAILLYDNFKDVNGTLLMQYASKMMYDLDKLVKWIPSEN